MGVFYTGLGVVGAFIVAYCIRLFLSKDGIEWSHAIPNLLILVFNGLALTLFVSLLVSYVGG